MRWKIKSPMHIFYKKIIFKCNYHMFNENSSKNIPRRISIFAYLHDNNYCWHRRVQITQLRRYSDAYLCTPTRATRSILNEIVTALANHSRVLRRPVKELDAVRDGLLIVRVQRIEIRAAWSLGLIRDCGSALKRSSSWPVRRREEAREDPPEASQKPLRPCVEQLRRQSGPAAAAFGSRACPVLALALKLWHQEDETGTASSGVEDAVEWLWKAI